MSARQGMKLLSMLVAPCENQASSTGHTLMILPSSVIVLVANSTPIVGLLVLQQTVSVW